MSLADHVVERALSDRQEAYSAEVQELIEATYRVIGDTGDFSPPVRAILAEAGMSNPAFYRHFKSKDELLLVMLDEGRYQLATYLGHRVEAVKDPNEKVAEWIRGVLAQASDPDAARRTRPFFADIARLHSSFPDEQQRSEQQLIGQLAALLGQRSSTATIIYTLVFGALGRYLQAQSVPTDDEVDAVVEFVLAGLGADR
jgi:AcrR family transcriptional regulator